MISKRFLFVSVCFVVLVVAVGAYGYVLYMEVSSLGSRLEDLQREINLLKYRIGFTNTSKTFNFFWGGPIAEKFNLTTFWINATFKRINETRLVITVKTNDLRDYGYRYVGIVFDVNHNGEIDERDEGQMYKASNQSLRAYLDGPYIDGQRFFYSIDGLSFIEFECYFDPQLGYTYVIPVDLQELKLTNDLIHLEYGDAVSVEFCFGMELIA